MEANRFRVQMQGFGNKIRTWKVSNDGGGNGLATTIQYIDHLGKISIHLHTFSTKGDAQDALLKYYQANIKEAKKWLESYNRLVIMGMAGMFLSDEYKLFQQRYTEAEIKAGFRDGQTLLDWCVAKAVEALGD